MTSIGSEQLNIAGYGIHANILTGEYVADLIKCLSVASSQSVDGGHKSANKSKRNLLETFPAVVKLARSREVRQLVEPVLGEDCFAVRGILFDETPGANWKVPWHQDLSIAVKERIETSGFGPWSVKEGVPHVQPPVEILEQMLTVRLHLDDCLDENGPVRVLPGSHLRGRLSPHEIVEFRQSITETICAIPTGDALLMRPLILHASSAATSPLHRRVIHIEYASCDLPNGLKWFGRV